MNNKIQTIILYVCVIALSIMLMFCNWHYAGEMAVIKGEANGNIALLREAQDKLDIVNGKLTTSMNNYNELDRNYNALKNQFANLQKDYDIANMTVADLKSEEYELIYIGDYKLTHYCAEIYEHICGTGDGLTATGTYVTPGRTVAVDPRVIPYGTKLYIEGYGWRIAEDCGGAVNGNHIDIAVDTHSQAMAMGVVNGGVWILVEK